MQWRVKSLEGFRDCLESLVMYVLVIRCAAALVISMASLLSKPGGAPGEWTARGAFTIFNECSSGCPRG